MQFHDSAHYGQTQAVAFCSVGGVSLIKFIENMSRGFTPDDDVRVGLSVEVGFIFQSFYLLQRQTALENVELPLIYANVPEKQRKERAKEMLIRVGLEDKMYHYPKKQCDQPGGLCGGYHAHG